MAGLVGTIGRIWITGLVGNRLGEAFPFGTLVVNCSGCLLAGIVFCLGSERLVLGETTATILAVGLLGGFTTFSAYGLQTFSLIRDGNFALAAANVALSNILGLILVWAGYSLTRIITSAN